MRYKGGSPPLMIYTQTRDDIPLLSQWIKKSRSEERDFLEVPPGFEPGIKVLQTLALPLGYGTEYLI